jgi:transcriptional regulator with XRE-family HTH domain
MDLNSTKIRETRTSKGWTQQQLAEISDLSLRTIQRVEVQGLGSLETSKSLAAAFEVERDSLLTAINRSKKDTEPSKRIDIYFLLLSFMAGSFIGAMGLWLIT